MAWRATPVSPAVKRKETGTLSTRGDSPNRMIAGAEMDESESGEEDESWERPNIVKEASSPRNKKWKNT